jgi:hypothetical protein
MSLEIQNSYMLLRLKNCSLGLLSRPLKLKKLPSGYFGTQDPKLVNFGT